MPVPVIDLTAPPGQAAARIDDALRHTGFFVIAGHGVPGRALASTYQVTREFFALPPAAKRKASADPPDPYRGYTSPADRWADGSLAAQLEKFEACSFETPADMAAAGYGEKWQAQLKPNIWPPGLPEMRVTWQAYLTEMHGLGDRLLRLMALALRLPEDWLAGRCGRACSFLVANHYLPARDEQQAGQFRLQAHTDIEALTILYQDTDIGGLQVRTLDGGWEDVPVIPGTFIVNIGDMMAMWTGGKWRATPHRVRNSGDERISIPFFHGPDKDCILEPIPGCAGTQPLRQPVAAGDWTEQRMARLSRDGSVTA